MELRYKILKSMNKKSNMPRSITILINGDFWKRACNSMLSKFLVVNCRFACSNHSLYYNFLQLFSNILTIAFNRIKFISILFKISQQCNDWFQQTIFWNQQSNNWFQQVANVTNDTKTVQHFANWNQQRTLYSPTKFISVNNVQN